MKPATGYSVGGTHLYRKRDASIATLGLVQPHIQYNCGMHPLQLSESIDSEAFKAAAAHAYTICV